MTCIPCRDTSQTSLRGPDHLRGLFLISQKVPITEAIEEIVLIWSTTEADEWSDQIVWLPV
jgi:hypothetical protein